MDISELLLVAENEGEKKGISDLKAKNMAVLRYIVHRIPLGAIFTLSQALSMLRFVHVPQVVPRTVFRGLFEIASGFSIPVFMYKKCHAVALPTLHKIVVSDDNDRDEKDFFPTAEKKTVYRLQSDLSVEVDPERTLRGFRYGRSIVPESSIDAEALKSKEERCLILLGFTDANRVPRHCFMGEPDVLLAPPTDRYAYSALSAFVIAMAELDKYAICRYIPRKSVHPTIVALIPRKKKKKKYNTADSYSLSAYQPFYISSLNRHWKERKLDVGEHSSICGGFEKLSLRAPCFL